MKIARVFPRRTRATPNDDLVFTNCPPMFALEIDEVHISVAFTYDMKHAEWLEMQWRALGVPVKMGGPASVSYTHLRAHETRHDLVCRLLLEKNKNAR